MSQTSKGDTTILGPQRRADLKPGYGQFLRCPCLNSIPIPPRRRLPDNWLILYPLQLARLAWCFHNLTAFQGCLDSTDGNFFSSIAPLPIGSFRLWPLHMVGQMLTWGWSPGQSSPRTHPIKKAILRRLGRLLKLNFQLIFKLRRAPQTLENEAAFWAR
jgi:hypothetical protein